MLLPHYDDLFSEIHPSSMSGDDRPSSKALAVESLASFRLLDLLRQSEDDLNTQDLVELLTSFPKPRLGQRNKTAPLHLAVRTARKEIFPLVLDHRKGDMNAQDLAGNTPLHIAASLGRAEIVAILLAQPDVDDMIRNDAGQTCLEISTSSEVARMLQINRAQFNATFLDLAATYVSGQPNDPLLAWLSRPRARCIDFSAKLPGTGSTILHEAAKRKDLPLLQACHERGADLLARDARGKTPMDYAREDRVRHWFREAMTAEGRVLKQSIDFGNRTLPRQLSVASSQSLPPPLPVRKGYLNKWVNITKGYKQRWFVLSNGSLSYYRHQDEEGKASRGIIAMQHAKVVGLGEDKLKFEIVSTIAKFRFYLKADHPLEAMRWVEDLQAHAEGSSWDMLGTSPTSTRDNIGASQTLSASSMTSTSSLEQATPALSKRKSVGAGLGGKAKQVKNAASKAGSLLTRKDLPPGSDSFNTSVAPSLADSGEEEDREDGSIITVGDSDDNRRPPQDENFGLLISAAKSQLEASQQLLESLALGSDYTPSTHTHNAANLGVSPTPRPAASRSSSNSIRQAEVKEALQDSLRKLGSMLDEYTVQVSEREKWFSRRYEREIEARQLWEDNMQKIAAQQEELEQQLSREYEKGSRRKKELREARLTLLGSPSQLHHDSTADLVDPSQPSPAHKAFPTDEAHMHTLTPTQSRGISPLPGAPEDSSDDEDDEFFEAIESGIVPVPDLPNVSEQQWPVHFIEAGVETITRPYGPYKNLRTKLPISVDDRPSVSLWGILKSSIGKDLTKISFPVSFNEPTSMLERMAEDMEFSECLAAATLHKDSTKRIAYVAAFAMSNYSSTIGRIAKPFNPMLGETFEYADMTKKYRYISEQVSHHPPVSACIAESATFRFYAEVDAKSKFTGKSFEIRPTGVSHCDLRIPREWAPGYPSDWMNNSLEHYSWKKVTSSVSNFILGTPTIDHFGDMVITNHRTGDRCVLTFKPKGWRGANSCEIKGHVTDASGQKVWDIAGRWNSQLVARRAGAGLGELQPDESVPHEEPEYMLLWKNSVKPEKLPFNLTPYAITLNDKAEGLVTWLPPTDCRLRPDLHAFEAGKFEEANDLKIGLEEIQRKTRRLREAGELPPHRPRWFERATEPDTGEGYWKPVTTDTEPKKVAYWEERERVGTAKLRGEPAEWKDVEPIFGSYALL